MKRQMTATEKIARDMDSGAVRFAVLDAQSMGVEITVRSIAKATGIETHRVEPVLRQMAEEWTRAQRPSRFVQ